MTATNVERSDDAIVTRFTLFVAGNSARSRRAIQNIRQIVDSGLSGPCEVDVVDVLEFPEEAERERILATPTLLRDHPPPRRRVTGDLSNREQVLGFIAPELRPDLSIGSNSSLPFEEHP